MKSNDSIQDMIGFFEDFLVKEKDLFLRDIHGFQYWHFIRFDFYTQLLVAKGWINKTYQTKPLSCLDVFLLGFKLLKNAFHKNIRCDKKRTELLILNSANRVQMNDKFIDPLTNFARTKKLYDLQW